MYPRQELFVRVQPFFWNCPEMFAWLKEFIKNPPREDEQKNAPSHEEPFISQVAKIMPNQKDRRKDRPVVEIEIGAECKFFH
jgi:hypothetical protein